MAGQGWAGLGLVWLGVASDVVVIRVALQLMFWSGMPGRVEPSIFSSIAHHLPKLRGRCGAQVSSLSDGDRHHGDMAIFFSFLPVSESHLL